MYRNRKKANKKIRVLETLWLISTSLLIGLIFTYKFFGESLPSSTIKDFLTFVATWVMMSALGFIPITMLVYLVFQYFFGDEDPYLTGWRDGIDEYPAYQKEVNESEKYINSIDEKN